jgi:hypothetical protein
VWEAVQQLADESQGESTMMSLRDHLRNPENLSWAVEDLVVRSGLSIIAAPPKAGKSCFVRWFIYCMASGHPFFDRPVNAGNVLYYAAEEPKAVVDNEFGKIIRKFGYPERHEINAAIGAIRQSTFTERLQREITQFRAKVVVIDPLFDAITVDDEKSYPQVKSALRDLRRVALDRGVHIMVAHHTRKASNNQGSAGDILGSQALRGATEHNFTIVGEKTATRKFHAEQRCGDTIDGRALLYDTLTGEVRLGDVIDSAKGREDRKQHDLDFILVDVLTLLHHEGRPLNYTEITDRLTGKNTQKKEALDHGVRTGQLTKTKGPNNSDLYTPTSLEEMFPN